MSEGSPPDPFLETDVPSPLPQDLGSTVLPCHGQRACLQSLEARREEAHRGTGGPLFFLLRACD